MTERPYRATPTVELARMVRELRELCGALDARQRAVRCDVLAELTFRARELRDGAIGTAHGAEYAPER